MRYIPTYIDGHHFWAVYLSRQIVKERFYNALKVDPTVNGLMLRQVKPVPLGLPPSTKYAYVLEDAEELSTSPKRMQALIEGIKILGVARHPKDSEQSWMAALVKLPGVADAYATNMPTSYRVPSIEIDRLRSVPEEEIFNLDLAFAFREYYFSDNSAIKTAAPGVSRVAKMWIPRRKRKVKLSEHPELCDINYLDKRGIMHVPIEIVFNKKSSFETSTFTLHSEGTLDIIKNVLAPFPPNLAGFLANLDVCTAVRIRTMSSKGNALKQADPSPEEIRQLNAAIKVLPTKGARELYWHWVRWSIIQVDTNPVKWVFHRHVLWIVEILSALEIKLGLRKRITNKTEIIAKYKATRYDRLRWLEGA